MFPSDDLMPTPSHCDAVGAEEVGELDGDAVGDAEDGAAGTAERG